MAAGKPAAVFSCHGSARQVGGQIAMADRIIVPTISA